MLYLYGGTVLVVLVNVLLITRTYALARQISVCIVLILAIGCLPFYVAHFTEAHPNQYEQIEQISLALKRENTAEAIEIKNLISDALENEKISMSEYDEINELFNQWVANSSKNKISKLINN
jgi:hypothetical protein